jgi:hypothetical protein
VAQYEAALRSMTYANTSESDDGGATVAAVVNDGTQTGITRGRSLMQRR